MCETNNILYWQTATPLYFQILELLVQRGKLANLKAIDISNTNALSENVIYKFIQKHGGQLSGLMLNGKPKLTENFWINVIPFLKNIE